MSELCYFHHSKSGGSSSLGDVATGTRRPTPPGTGKDDITGRKQDKLVPNQIKSGM